MIRIDRQKDGYYNLYINNILAFSHQNCDNIFGFLDEAGIIEFNCGKVSLDVSK